MVLERDWERSDAYWQVTMSFYSLEETTDGINKAQNFLESSDTQVIQIRCDHQRETGRAAAANFTLDKDRCGLSSGSRPSFVLSF
jgi:hypothetical protein